MCSQQLRPLASTGLATLRRLRRNGRMFALSHQSFQFLLMATNTLFAPDISLERALTESYLIQQSHFAPEPPISSFPQSLREHGSESLQLRVRLVTESRARSAQADVGGFDVRRTDWATLRNMEDPTRAGSTVWSRQDEDWEAQTLYVVSCETPASSLGVSLNLIRTPPFSCICLGERAIHGQDYPANSSLYRFPLLSESWH